MGPARALEKSVGPARALEEREKFRNNAPFLNTFLRKQNIFLPPNNDSDGFNLLLSLLAEMIPNDFEITSKSKFGNQSMLFW